MEWRGVLFLTDMQKSFSLTTSKKSSKIVEILKKVIDQRGGVVEKITKGIYLAIENLNLIGPSPIFISSKEVVTPVPQIVNKGVIFCGDCNTNGIAVHNFSTLCAVIPNLNFNKDLISRVCSLPKQANTQKQAILS